MIAENLLKIREQIAEAAAKVNRSAETIKLVAVSKRFPAAKINEAYTAGQIMFGENYIQEVEQKKNRCRHRLSFILSAICRATRPR